MKIIFLLFSSFCLAAVLVAYLAGIRVFLVTSGSMEPDFSRGDLIITKRQSSYKLGDAISYRDSETKAVVTHKISSMVRVEDSSWYKARGEANDKEDEGLIAQHEVIGKVTSVIPAVGRVLFLPKQELILGLTWTLSLIIIFLELKQIVLVVSTQLEK